jgi:hypothetical protein
LSKLLIKVLISCFIFFTIAIYISAETVGTKKNTTEFLRASYGPHSIVIYESDHWLNDSAMCISHNQEILHIEKLDITSFIDKETNSIAGAPIGKDITGNGIPNIVIAGHTGGKVCCYIYYILEFAEELKLIDTVEAAPSSSGFKDIDNDGKYEIVTNDSIFMYWNLASAASPYPQVVLELNQSNNYAVANDVMRKPPPSLSTLREKAHDLQSSFTNDHSHAETYQMMSPMAFSYMVDLVYSGNKKAARTFCKYYYFFAGSTEQDNLFWEAFVERLSSSRYFEEIWYGFYK